MNFLIYKEKVIMESSDNCILAVKRKQDDNSFNYIFLNKKHSQYNNDVTHRLKRKIKQKSVKNIKILKGTKITKSFSVNKNNISNEKKESKSFLYDKALSNMETEKRVKISEKENIFKSIPDFMNYLNNTISKVKFNLELTKVQRKMEIEFDLNKPSTSTCDNSAINNQNSKILPTKNHFLNKSHFKNLISNLNEDYNLCVKPIKALSNRYGISSSSYSSGNIFSIFSDLHPQCLTGKKLPATILGDIYIQMLKEEKEYPLIDYMPLQTDINDKMRAVLINWIIDVHLRFNLQPETLFVAVGIIDKYLSHKYINKNHLQLIGVTSLLIACKYEEVTAPLVSDCVYITDNTYTKEQILWTERDILMTLGYKFTFPSILKFYDILALNFSFNEKEYYQGRYLIESFLIDYSVNKFSCSLIACSIIYIVMKINPERFYDYHLIKAYTQEEENVLKQCANNIIFLVQHLDDKTLYAVKTKYLSKEYYEVSKLKLV